jgi:hypothetical protein
MSLQHAATIAVILATPLLCPAAEFSVECQDDGIVINIDGKLFTKYVTKGEGGKPYFWPVIGPTGKRMTRAYPMGDVEGERQDHVHHRSIWFGHDHINDSNTWHETATFTEQYKKKPEQMAERLKTLGSTVNRKIVTATGKVDRAILELETDYLDSDGKRMCQDTRQFVFHVDPKTGSRLIDVELIFKGTEESVTFHDAKDAGFSVRVAHPICVAADVGGTIINSNGEIDGDAWAKRAAWCDFNGPVDGETLGVAILNHPSSFRYPTPWHARTYGLFTANPFGTKSLNKSAEDGTFSLKKGETMTLRYRIILHQGNAKAAGIAEAFTAYAKEQH